MLRNCHETLQKLIVVPLLFRRGGTVPLVEQFHFCFLEGAEQFHWRNSSTSIFQVYNILKNLSYSFLSSSFYNFCIELILSNGQNKRILAILALISINDGTVPLLLLEKMVEQFHFCFLQIDNYGYATELLILQLLYRVDTFKWQK